MPTEGHVMTAVLVTGASGFVGSRLVTALAEAGQDIRAMARRPREYRGAGRPVYGDGSDPESLPDTLAHQSAAYYLVHSLARKDFAAVDATAARSFGEAAAAAGLERIIYLGGLGGEKPRVSGAL